MAERIGTDVQDNQADALAALYDGGSLEIYTGSQPTTANDSPTGSLLVTITLPTPAFGASTAGVASKAGTWSGVAGAAGVAGWFRITDSGSNHPIDGAITATGLGGELELDTTTIASGQTVTINTFTLTQPAN